MVNLVKFDGSSASTDSKTVAEVFGKTHQAVRRCVEALDCSDEFKDANFKRSSYLSPQNKRFDCYLITRDGFSFLGMGFVGKKAAKWKEAYIKAFNEMESYIKKDAGTDSLMGAINEASRHIDLIAVQGSRWGKAGSEIRKNKAKAIERLGGLVDKAQMQLGFQLTNESK